MHKLEAVISMLDHTLNTKRKRHIAGGVLISMSLLFGSLAITIMSLREDKGNEQYIE